MTTLTNGRNGAPQWQPIETAPIKPFDEANWYMAHSNYLLLFDGHVHIGNYQYTATGKGRWKANGFVRNPTHWMPLPPPPEQHT